nr:MAG TPA: hypothetical protein [Caudoviricetes sp.]
MYLSQSKPNKPTYIGRYYVKTMLKMAKFFGL